MRTSFETELENSGLLLLCGLDETGPDEGKEEFGCSSDPLEALCGGEDLTLI